MSYQELYMSYPRVVYESPKSSLSLSVLLDLYTFDADETTAQTTYDEVCNAYNRIFQRLQLPYLKGKLSSFINDVIQQLYVWYYP